MAFLTYCPVCLKMQFVKFLPVVVKAITRWLSGMLVYFEYDVLAFFIFNFTRGNLAFVLFVWGSNHWNKLEKGKQPKGMRNNLQLNP